MCGKDNKGVSFLISDSGSPPHVRERHAGTVVVMEWDGITPACAGKTPKTSRPTNTKRDHPRMCGKDPMRTITQWPITGSPPHVRERPIFKQFPAGRPRITPACAGKTQADCLKPLQVRDHPRMCGKDIGPALSVRHIVGSPPHVRERQLRMDKMTGCIRITPACAGKTP